jgi:transcriptional regulatory protein RtcR
MEPNLDYELGRWAQTHGTRITFSKEARKMFLDFATAPAATWGGNFRDFSAAIERMATLADGGRISVPHVRDEIERLEASWQRPSAAKLTSSDEVLSRYLDADALVALDRFDRVQLADVLTVCTSSRSLSDAGRALFAESRKRRSSQNDADRVRKYLGRFGISWADLNG